MDPPSGPIAGVSHEVMKREVAKEIDRLAAEPEEDDKTDNEKLDQM